MQELGLKSAILSHIKIGESVMDDPAKVAIVADTAKHRHTADQQIALASPSSHTKPILDQPAGEKEDQEMV